MIESEFQALIEAAAPDHDVWQPTAEQLHQMFWGQPLAKLVDAPPPQAADVHKPDWFDLPFNDYKRLRRSVKKDLLAQNMGMGMSGRQARVMLNALDPEKPAPRRYVVQIMSAGQWFDIDESRTDDEGVAVRWRDRQLRVQPHLSLRLHDTT